MYDFLKDFLYIMKGFMVNFGICIVTISIGFVIGFFIAFTQFIYKNSYKGKLCSQLVSIICGTPLIIQLAIYVYSLSPVINSLLSKFSLMISGLFMRNILIRVNPMFWCIIGIAINSACYFSLIFLDSMNSIDETYFINLQGLNISKSLSVRKFLTPMIIKNAYNKITFEFISLLKETSVISTVGVADIFLRSRELATIKNMYFPYMITCAGTFYISFLIYKNWLHKYFNKFLNLLLRYSLMILY